jgi:beta-lactamase regulating signal transducer with metallopeptidase domain
MRGDFLETSRPVMEWVVRTTWEASLIAALVLLAQWMLRGRVSARWRYNLWLLVVARLLLPAVPGTHYSPFNLVQIPTPKQQAPAVPEARPRLVPAPPLRATPVPGPAEPGDTGRLYLASDVDWPRLPELVAPLPEEPAVAVPVAPALTVERSRPAQTPPWAMAGLSTGEPAADDGRAAERMTPVPPQRLSTRAPAREPARVPAAPVTVPWFQRVNWLAVAAITWVAGVAFVLTRLTWVTLRLTLAVRRLPPAQDPLLRALLAECAAQLRVRRLPRLLEAPDHFGPALVGLLRPCVVLPACVLRGVFDRQELRLILTHELAHMKRRDVAVNWVLAVLGALHWFNPVLWLTFRRMRADREMACDELVLSVNGRDAGRAYGPTILKLLQTLSRGSALPGMVGVLEGKTSIRRRFAMIARFDRQKNDAAPVLGVVLSLLIGGVALTGAVRGQAAPAGQPREISVDLSGTESRGESSADTVVEATGEATAEAASADARPSDLPESAEGDDAAREAAEQARDAAREPQEAARESADAARERMQELQNAAAERQEAIREARAEAERAMAEARQQVDAQRAAGEEAINAARQAMQDARAQGQQRVSEARAALQEAKQVQGQAGDGADETAAAVVERELALNQAVNERDQALREAQEAIEQATRERDEALAEAGNGIEQARAEHQEAIQEAAQSLQELMAEQQAATQELFAAERALAQVRGELGRAGAASPAVPGEGLAAADPAATPAPVVAPTRRRPLTCRLPRRRPIRRRRPNSPRRRLLRQTRRQTRRQPTPLSRQAPGDRRCPPRRSRAAQAVAGAIRVAAIRAPIPATRAAMAGAAECIPACPACPGSARRPRRAAWKTPPPAKPTPARRRRCVKTSRSVSTASRWRKPSRTCRTQPASTSCRTGRAWRRSK